MPGDRNDLCCKLWCCCGRTHTVSVEGEPVTDKSTVNSVVTSEPERIPSFLLPDLTVPLQDSLK